MSKSKKKGLFINIFLLKELLLNKNKKIIIKTLSRSSTIFPEMVGSTLAIHNGRIFIPLHIDNYIVGYKLGQFILTRRFNGHKNSDKKIKKK